MHISSVNLGVSRYARVAVPPPPPVSTIWEENLSAPGHPAGTLQNFRAYLSANAGSVYPTNLPGWVMSRVNGESDANHDVQAHDGASIKRWVPRGATGSNYRKAFFSIPATLANFTFDTRFKGSYRTGYGNSGLIMFFRSSQTPTHAVPNDCVRLMIFERGNNPTGGLRLQLAKWVSGVPTVLYDVTPGFDSGFTTVRLVLSGGNVTLERTESGLGTGVLYNGIGAISDVSPTNTGFTLRTTVESAGVGSHWGANSNAGFQSMRFST